MYIIHIILLQELADIYKKKKDASLLKVFEILKTQFL